MTFGPSRAFRRWCAATILLVVSWSLPGSVYARVSPMEVVKYQLRKPNFVIVVESAESMQGIPGENPTRFNEVGADCQNGDRFCRLYGQAGRCEFSGMGAQGYVFDYVAAGTATQTGTQSQIVVTATVTVTQTGTNTLTGNTSAVMTSTSSGVSQTAIATATTTVATSQSATGTSTASPTATQTLSQTGTQTTSISQTGTQTGTQTTSNSQTGTQTGTQTTSNSQTGTQTGTQTVSNSQTNTQTATQTGSNSQSQTQTATQTSSNSASQTQTATQTSSNSASNTRTATQTVSNSASQTQTATQTSSSSASQPQTASQTSSSSASNTQTATQTVSNSGSNTQTATRTVSNSSTNTDTDTRTISNSGSNTDTATRTISSSGTNTDTATRTVSSSSTNTDTFTRTISSSSTNTDTFTRTVSSSSTNTDTFTRTVSSSSTNTDTATRTVSSSSSQTQTATHSTSSSLTETQTQTCSTSSSSSGTRTASQTNTDSKTNSGTSSQTYTRTQSGNTTGSFTNTALNSGIDANIVAYWPLDETAGPYSDESGNNNDATAVGSPTRVTPGAVLTTQSPAAENFGTNSGNPPTKYATVPTMVQPLANATVAAWVKPGDFNQRQVLVAYTPNPSDSGGGGLRLFLNQGYFFLDDGSALSSNTAPGINKGVSVQRSVGGNGDWYLVVGTVSGATWTIYYFDTQSSCASPSGSNVSSTVSVTFQPGSKWCLGAECNGSTYLNGVNGSLDEVRVWNRPLSLQEVKNLCSVDYPSTSVPTGTKTASYTATKTLTASSSSTATRTGTSSSSFTETSSKTQTSSSSSSSSSTNTHTGTDSFSGSSTYTNTGSKSTSSTATYTMTETSSTSGTGTYTMTETSSTSGTATYTNTASSSLSGSATYTNTASMSVSGTATMTNSASSSSSGTATYTKTASSSLSGSGTYTNTASMSVTGTGTMTATGSSSSSGTASYTITASWSGSATATYTNTGSTSVSGTGSMTSTASYSSSGTASYTNTGTLSVSSTATHSITGTSSLSASATYTITGTSSLSSTATRTVTGTSSLSASGTMTMTGTSSASTSVTGTSTATYSGVTGTHTTTIVQTFSGSATVTQTATAPAVVSYTDLTTVTQLLTGTQVLTSTATASLVMQPVPDPNDCAGTSCMGTSAYCYLNASVPCTLDSTCSNLTPGDFCRYLNINDGTGRLLGDFCADNATGKTSCRYQQVTTCSSNGDCDGGVGDYCVLGTPAKMCQKTGLWCADDGYGCDSTSDACIPATSRLMMVKNAVRRVVLEHAYDDKAPVKIGHMHTFQADRTGDPTKLFPYVKLQTTSTRTDVKFLPRSELVKGVDADGKPCFSESAGPSGICTIDYGGGGAVPTPSVEYHLQSGNNSRYAVPAGDGKSYTREDCAWGSCNMMYAFSGVGKGLYEGSYYNFSYTWGKPVDSGSGSVSEPVYYTTYQGKSFGSGGSYWYLMDAERSEKVNENKYGANEFTGSTWSRGAEYPLPLVGASGDPLSGSATCGLSNGAQWDRNLVPMVNDTSFGGNSSLNSTQKALLNAARLDKASYGGFYATGNLEPVACTLKDEGANDKYHSVDGYMSVVKGSDSTANGNSAPCWENHVLLVVDGLPRGPGDVAVGGVNCAASECKYDPNELVEGLPNPNYNLNLNGCVCPAVLKARALAKDAKVNVHVIAATTNLDPRNLYAAHTLNNIARAGSTRTDFINIPRYATSEDELYYWLNYEMKQALRVTVATTPASAASGSQSLQGITAGNWLFQTTTELPEWKGNLVGFSIGTATVTSTTTATATQYTVTAAWDVATQNKFASWTSPPGPVPTATDRDWWKTRRVFFSDGNGQVRSVLNSDGTINSSATSALLGLGMGGNEAETVRIVEWMLGKTDPNDNQNFRTLNPAVMGSVLNSVPIDVGPPGVSPMPGGNHFWYAHSSRTELIYVGADDGMLHAFQAANGLEAFAFIPADMVPTIARLYAQGGQRYSPNNHVYGLAASPKVKNVCVANCTVTGPSCSDTTPYNDAVCPQWKTVLVVGEGPGGNHPFALDITDPFDAGVATLTNSSLLWHVGYKNASGISTTHLGETDSVPAFTYNQTTDQNDYRVLMASGYPYPPQSTTETYLIDASVMAGALTGPGTTTIRQPGGSCNTSPGQEFTAIADVAVARDYRSGGNQNLLAAYVADTWGTLHQYAPAYSPVLDKNPAPLALGCHHPLHFSPAVVQLNRNDPTAETSVYLAQVTNSILDPVTVKYSSDKFPASKLVILKLSSIGNDPPAPDASFGSGGSIQLSADAVLASNHLCGVTTGKASTASDCPGGSPLPNSARPTGTPVAVLRSDGGGFQILTTWYTPPAENWDNCATSATNGNSYVTLHEFLSNGAWSQIVGIEIPHQYVTGVQFVGTTLFITAGDGTAPGAPEPPQFGQNFQSVNQILKTLTGDRFVRTAWTERLDAD